MNTNCKYYKYHFYKTWADRIRSFKDLDVQWNLYHAVDDYGLHGIEPTTLTGDALEFFNTEVRPNLDIQHKRYERK